MKRNTLVLIGLIVLGLCSWEAQAANLSHHSIINMEDNVPTGYENIHLHGDLDTSVGPNAVVAGVNENSVYIHFSRNFGNVSISIFNAEGALAYYSVVDTSMQQTFIIPITGWANGHFVLELNNANGYAEGDFNRN